mmetsp:Transcript_14525/g.18322  ORF Transcript_14525/g.18322 Transcript_14525/m.18322 type:complete len:147 (+) Transcript_14525:374-814(+)
MVNGDDLNGSQDDKDHDDEANKLAKEGLKSSNWTRMPINFFAGIKLSLQRIFDPLICGCCKRRYSKRDKLSHFSDKQASEEMKIVRWIRFMRCAEHALKTRLFSDEEWSQIVQDSLYRYIEVDDQTREVREVEIVKVVPINRDSAL